MVWPDHPIWTLDYVRESEPDQQDERQRSRSIEKTRQGKQKRKTSNHMKERGWTSQVQFSAFRRPKSTTEYLTTLDTIQGSLGSYDEEKIQCNFRPYLYTSYFSAFHKITPIFGDTDHANSSPEYLYFPKKHYPWKMKYNINNLTK